VCVCAGMCVYLQWGTVELRKGCFLCVFVCVCACVCVCVR
jgi:hypothetical protein